MNVSFKLTNLLFFSLFFWLISTTIQAQNIPSNVSIENIDALSDEELYTYYQQATSQGYSIAQIKILARARGVSNAKIADFERRIEAIENGFSDDTTVQNNVLEVTKPVTISNTKTKRNSEIFGYDFFTNENISFTPNLNLATPANYKLGPGDELVINIWGAAERTYNLAVDREGAIRLPNIGPVFVNGMSIEEATGKIKGSLKKIYNGISAPKSSPYKIFVGISLSNVRTVQVNIIGEVKTPGTYSVSALSTVLNALYAAGGPTENGTFREIKLVRNGEAATNFDMYDYLINGSQKGNSTLRDQDVIIVSPYISRVSVSGAVKRPGLFELKPTENLDDLIRYTSGFTSNAYKERIVLERIDGDRKIVKELLTSQSSSEILQDGDKLQVKSIIDKFKNRVEIEGAVYRPGVYELTNGLTVFKLIEKAAGVLDKAFLQRGAIIRSIDGVSSEVIPFSLEMILNKKTTIKLENNDVVKIYNKYSLQEQNYISISGAVNNPKQIPFIENTTIEDLVLISGGFQDGADVSKIDVYRNIKDDEENRLTESFRVEVSRDLSSNQSNQFILMPNDRVSVRFIKGFSEQITVAVKGEVNYPGDYGVESKTQRISDIIEKAGGVSKFAYIEGASLVRRNPFYKKDVQIEIAAQVSDNISDKDEDIELKNAPSLSVGINLAEILKNPNNKQNLILKNGDVLVVPSIKQTVKIEGEVLVPSLVRYDKSYSLKDYISNSGGFSNKAKKGKTYVVYLNGEIEATKRFLFFKSYPKLEPGALVIVPKKEERKNRASTEQVVGITSGVLTIALLLDNIFSE